MINATIPHTFTFFSLTHIETHRNLPPTPHTHTQIMSHYYNRSTEKLFTLTFLHSLTSVMFLSANHLFKMLFHAFRVFTSNTALVSYIQKKGKKCGAHEHSTQGWNNK